MTNTPDILLRAMAVRAAAGLYVKVVDEDVEKFIASGGGVLSMYCLDEAQRERYCAAVEAKGARYEISAKAG